MQISLVERGIYVPIFPLFRGRNVVISKQKYEINCRLNSFPFKKKFFLLFLIPKEKFPIPYKSDFYRYEELFFLFYVFSDSGQERI